MISQILGSFKVKIKCRKNKTRVYAKVVPSDLQLGKYCTVGKKTHFSDNVIIGDFSYINGNFMDTFIESNTQIGKFCSLGPGVMVGMGNHPIELCSTHPILFDDYYKKQLQWKEVVLKYKGLADTEKITRIGHDVWIGARANIKRGITIGNGAVIASDAIVTKDVPPYAIVAGCPAKILRYRFEENDREFLTKNDDYCFWNWSEEVLRNNFDSMYQIQAYRKVIEQLQRESDN